MPTSLLRKFGVLEIPVKCTLPETHFSLSLTAFRVSPPYIDHVVHSGNPRPYCLMIFPFRE
jgi:hypothetical protein